MSKKKPDSVGLRTQQEIHHWLECLEAAATLVVTDIEGAVEDVTALADDLYWALQDRIETEE